MTQHDYIPERLLNSELYMLGTITQIIETNVADICVAHIEASPGDCLCIVFRDNRDGVSPITPDCGQCVQLIEAISVMASHIVHSED